MPGESSAVSSSSPSRLDAQRLHDLYGTVVKGFERILDNVRDTWSPCEETQIDDMAVQLRVWGIELDVKSGTFEWLVSNYHEEAAAIQGNLENIQSLFKAWISSVEQHEQVHRAGHGDTRQDESTQDKLLENFVTAVEDFCDLSEPFQILISLQMKTGLVAKVKERLAVPVGQRMVASSPDSESRVPQKDETTATSEGDTTATRIQSISRPLTGGERDQLDSTGLCLLSLDGGGVRGLSTLYVLRTIMRRLIDERRQNALPSVRSCEIFDMIGGTSTGGLITITLGRLEMDVKECISAYVDIMVAIFDTSPRQFRASLPGTIQTLSNPSPKKLKEVVENIIIKKKLSPSDRFNEGMSWGCRVVVCTAIQERNGIERLTTYDLDDKQDHFDLTICEAVFATLTDTRFFDRVDVATRKFIDAPPGAFNPINEVEKEASHIWWPDTGNLKPLVKCFMSVGTGIPIMNAWQDGLPSDLGKTLTTIATETENTANSFMACWRSHHDDGRYFRFNVEHGLSEYKEMARIETITLMYLNSRGLRFAVQECARKRMQKQCVYMEDFS
ncbi:hypothetical protein FDECE_15940 [Fusarium decemcellulare]|nr:hypothetical protein FDECE_15940 [Fusarium decemcellulare]